MASTVVQHLNDPMSVPTVATNIKKEKKGSTNLFVLQPVKTYVKS